MGLDHEPKQVLHGLENRTQLLGMEIRNVTVLSDVLLKTPH